MNDCLLNDVHFCTHITDCFYAYIGYSNKIIPDNLISYFFLYGNLLWT